MSEQDEAPKQDEPCPQCGHKQDEAPKRSPNEPISITLRKPFSFGSRRIDTITIRPVKGKDMRKINRSEGDTATTLKMASQLTGEIAEVIDELQGEDLGEVIEAVNFFFESIQRTGPR